MVRESCNVLDEQGNIIDESRKVYNKRGNWILTKYYNDYYEEWEERWRFPYSNKEKKRVSTIESYVDDNGEIKQRRIYPPAWLGDSNI